MNITELIGKTLTEVIGKKYAEEIIFKTTGGEVYKMFHYRDCCESVCVEDICGELSDLVGSPILQAEEATNQKTPTDAKQPSDNSFTWTFYRLATMKGQVVIRWLGESNGNYSESVDFEIVEPKTQYNY